MAIGRHVVFYREGTGGNLVSRILHRRMLPERHVIDAEDSWP
jgi:plasmid stabilization system protein ParE